MKALIVCKHPEGVYENSACRLIEKDFSPIYEWKDNLSKNHLKDIDLVISLGGDGTVLSASHYLIDKPILAVNSSPKTSEGALTTIPIDELNKKLKEIKLNGFKTEKLERIEVLINGQLLDILALNEVFIANEKAYHTSKYKIIFNEEEEEQRSSGLIFSTGTGSTAWFKSAGGKPFSPQAKFIKMIVREPYIRNIIKFSKIQETIDENKEFEIEVLIPSVLAIDSIREFKLNRHDKIRIRISNHPLIRII